MKRYVKAARTLWGNIQYKVYGNGACIGGSPTLEGAIKIAKEQVYEEIDNPWMSQAEKINYLRSISIVDVDNNKDVTDSSDIKSYIEKLVSQVRMQGSKTNKAKTSIEPDKDVLYIIRDSQGKQLSRPNPDDGELWDRVESMEARGHRGLRVVVYTGEK